MHKKKVFFHREVLQGWPRKQLSGTQFDKITSRYEYLEVFSPPSVYSTRECPFLLVCYFSCRYLAQLGLRHLDLPVPNFDHDDKRIFKTIFRAASRLELLLERLFGLGGVQAEVSGRGPRLLRSFLGVEITESFRSELLKALLWINSVHTRCIVKTSVFTSGVCKNRGFY